MKVYTKTGDKGKTSLVTGTRVKKYHLRIEAYGTIDELNSYLGLLMSFEINEVHKKTLNRIQLTLFSLASQLSQDKETGFKIPEITDSDIKFLENEIDKMIEALPDLKNLILPGGHQTAGFCHVARTVCRRAERLIIHLADEAEIAPQIIQYINRLSDFLFVLARKLNADFTTDETLWQPFE